jgi:hypothetical protein
MTGPIEPIRRSRRTRNARNLSVEPVAEAPNPNAGAGRADRVKPPPETPLAEGAAALSAHLLGQEGTRRGLRGGAPVLDAARSAYETAEWSGGADRRKKSGRKARIKT